MNLRAACQRRFDHGGLMLGTLLPQVHDDEGLLARRPVSQTHLSAAGGRSGPHSRPHGKPGNGYSQKLHVVSLEF